MRARLPRRPGLIVWGIALAFLLGVHGNAKAQQTATLSGQVEDRDQVPLPGINVVLQGTRYGAATNGNGRYTIVNIPPGEYVAVASGIGFETKKDTLTLAAGERRSWDVVLEASSYALNEVTVTARSQLREVEEKAFNVDVVDAQQLEATTMEMGDALDRVSGVRVRQSGGLGSRMNLSMNGFEGDQVKIFIDGVPMSNFGPSFQLNNIPVGLAKRIEVYKGVVPVGLGADALGGAVNIITDTYSQSHVEASYSYGSFNTHRSSINAVYVAESGFTAQVNAFQNYSDNDYEVEVDVADLDTGEYYEDRTVERFNDTYHNETVIASVGVVGTSYADRLLLGLTLGQNYDEVQTGSRLAAVFGDWYTEGNIIMPSLRYQKRDVLLDGLDVNLSASYNFGQERSVDTAHRRYNWLGQYKEFEGPGGERSYTRYEYRNNNGIAKTTWSYRINARHALSLSNTFNTFSREGQDALDPQDEIYSSPRKTRKNVAGLGYQYEREDWNASLFTKHYLQHNEYVQSYNPTGDYGDVAYRDRSRTSSHLGYGAAATWFVNDHLQLKASYERSYRLPASEELYGNAVNLDGNVELDPEESDNYNLGADYRASLGEGHSISLGENVFYRHATDFIRPTLNTNAVTQIMENLGSVTNLGFETQARYRYRDQFTVGANLTYQNLRNNTEYLDGRKSVVYRDRIPNMPYLYGNADAEYTFTGLEDGSLSISYHALYVHGFYLYWPSLGQSESKFGVPRQLSHDLRLTYTPSWAGRLQFTLECLNVTDNDLYDNFSLQKPGRSFTTKVRYRL